MRKTVLLDEWHLTVRIPAAAVTVVRRALNAEAFATALRRAIWAVVGRRPVLKRVRDVITR